MDRETLGREVRRVWIEFCREIGDDRPSHLASWEDMTEPEREVDRRIGEAIARMALADEVERLQKESRNTMLAESQQQAKDDDAIEAKLRQMFAAAQYPEVEDVYVSTPYCAYVTFSKLLLSSQVDCSEALFNLQIERTPPLRNRYRVTFIAPDQEEV